MLVTDQEPASLNKHSRRKGTTLQKQLVPFCWLPKSISHVYISTQLLPSMHPASRMENSQRVKADSEKNALQYLLICRKRFAFPPQKKVAPC